MVKFCSVQVLNAINIMLKALTMFMLLHHNWYPSCHMEIEIASRYSVPGQYQNLTGKTSCKDCSVGRFSGTNASIELVVCSECSKVRTSKPGSAVCSQCLPGTYVSARSTCEKCPSGYFTNSTEVAACHECSSGRTSKTRPQLKYLNIQL